MLSQALGRNTSPALGFALALALIIGATPEPARATDSGDTPPGLVVSSPAFGAGAPLPEVYTCYNAFEPSPPIGWLGGPSAARAYALTMDAPERPDGVLAQWVVYNLPAQVTSLAEDTPKVERLPGGALQGRNDLGNV